MYSFSMTWGSLSSSRALFTGQAIKSISAKAFNHSSRGLVAKMSSNTATSEVVFFSLISLVLNSGWSWSSGCPMAWHSIGHLSSQWAGKAMQSHLPSWHL